jgi:hypothetical protein
MEEPMPRHICISAVLALLITFGVSAALAHPSYFQSDCHHHRGTLGATPDRAQYFPGDPLVVTLSGGTRGGWIRALLYDQSGTEVARASGPTGAGDDSLGAPVTFPVALHAVAPTTPGDYLWQAAWFGNDDGSGHIANRKSTTIHVVARTDVPATEPPASPWIAGTWSRIKALWE